MKKVYILFILILINYLSTFCDNNDIEKILKLVLNDDNETARNLAYQLIIENDSELVKEKANYLLGYINYISENFIESEKRFKLVKNIKQEEVKYFLNLINIYAKDAKPVQDALDITFNKVISKTDSGISEQDKLLGDYSDYKEYAGEIPIRILLENFSEKIYVSTDNYIKINLQEPEKIRLLYSNKNFNIVVEQLDENFLFDEKYICRRIEIISLNNSIIKINSRSYRGKIIICKNGEKYQIINELDIEDYIKGVLKKEISPAWHKEILKAQAIAARTFAYQHIVNNPKGLYHLGSDWQAQEYGGADAEDNRCCIAVDETKGIIMTKNGKPITAYYHSDSGGHTESAYNVWGVDLDYTPAKRDKYGSQSPNRYWKTEIKEEKLRSILNKQGYDLDSIKSIKATDRTESGRYKTIKIKDSKGTIEIDSNKFRLIMGSQYSIKSTLILNIEKNDDIFYFEGRGFGHGVGLAQWSAKEMAEKGKNYEEILKYYYDNIKFEKI